MKDAPVFEEKDSVTQVPLRLDPDESIFVVFRKPTKAHQHEPGQKNWLTFTPVQEIGGTWEVGFNPKWGGPTMPVKFERLED